jgi:hypothetical protein
MNTPLHHHECPNCTYLGSRDTVDDRGLTTLEELDMHCPAAVTKRIELRPE